MVMFSWCSFRFSFLLWCRHLPRQTTTALLPRWLPAGPPTAQLVLAHCKPHRNVQLSLCKQAKNIVVLFLRGPGSSERLGRKPGSGRLRGAGTGIPCRRRATARSPPALWKPGLAARDPTRQTRRWCPAALGLASERCQVSSGQC